MQKDFSEILNKGIDSKLKRKNIYLFISYLLNILGIVCGFFFLNQTKNSLIFGIPTSVVYVTFFAVLLLFIIFLAYQSIFSKWAKEISRD